MDVQRIRKDFPILKRRISGKQLVYLDNAATSQVPRQVIETIHTYLSTYNSNIHRSTHTLGQRATGLYEQAHGKVAHFIGAENEREIIFLRNATEGINLVAYSLLSGVSDHLKLVHGDEVVITLMEHHSNLVPWQIAQNKGIVLKFVGVMEDGTLDMDELKESITGRTKLVCCTHVSNVLGTINPVREIAQCAHSVGALFLVDGAQSVPHLPVSVKEIDCDFMTFSGHKMLAPTGIGALYGKQRILDELAPFLYGGDMIENVTLRGASWRGTPWKFEAGTPNICGAIALGGALERESGQRLEGAIDYLERLGMEKVREHEKQLTEHVLKGLQLIPEVTVYGPLGAEQRCGLVTFNVDIGNGVVDAHVIAQFLNEEGIALRAGRHCAYPLVERLGLADALRVSFYIYNTIEEVDCFLELLRNIILYKLL